MDESQARKIARQGAMTRSLTYDVVRTSGGFDAFPRYYDAVGRTDKGDVVATYNCYGKRTDVEQGPGHEGTAMGSHPLSERMGIESKCEICGEVAVTYRRALCFTETHMGRYTECCNPCLVASLETDLTARCRIDEVYEWPDGLRSRPLAS